ncbi:hypothetical protein niasHT_037472 [Heterodera trifolii]|uniref:Secreted protein n=1 Tax=Heterodera trifolii TaxID=157864 RepID=A0ABD2ILP6_9BILA
MVCLLLVLSLWSLTHFPHFLLNISGPMEKSAAEGRKKRTNERSIAGGNQSDTAKMRGKWAKQGKASLRSKRRCHLCHLLGF